MAFGLAIIYSFPSSASAAPPATAVEQDLLGPVLAKRYGGKALDTLVDEEARDLRYREVKRPYYGARPLRDLRYYDYTKPRWTDYHRGFSMGGIDLFIAVPWPDNGGRICHGSLMVDGKLIASGANGSKVVISGRGLMRKTRFALFAFEVPFSDEDEANARMQVVGRKAERQGWESHWKSLPACPTTAEIRRADINAIDWRMHFQAYPASGVGSTIPDCIRGQLDRLGAPASGRTTAGAPAERTIHPLSWRGRRVIEACRTWELRRTDFECELERQNTRCEDQWFRSWPVEGRFDGDNAPPLDLQRMADHLLSNRAAEVFSRLGESGPMRAARREREAKAALAERQKAERIAAEIEARRKWEVSPEGRAALAAQAERQRKAEAQHARDFPYFVLIRCGDNGHFNITVCLNFGENTYLRLRNGGTETLYNMNRIFRMQPGRETRDGYRIDLRASYGLIIQNYSPQIMGVSVYNRRTGRQVFGREVGQGGIIATAR